MICDIKCISTQGTFSLLTEHNDPEEPVDISFETHEGTYGDTIKLFKKEFNSSYGIYGHIQSIDHTTNLDIYSILLRMKDFQLVKCTPIPKARKLPAGTIT